MLNLFPSEILKGNGFLSNTISLYPSFLSPSLQSVTKLVASESGGQKNTCASFLVVSANVPAVYLLSFTGFQARGGTDVHRDGWGIAFFEGNGVRLFLDPQPSIRSAVAEFVRHYPDSIA